MPSWPLPVILCPKEVRVGSITIDSDKDGDTRGWWVNTLPHAMGASVELLSVVWACYRNGISTHERPYGILKAYAILDVSPHFAGCMMSDCTTVLLTVVELGLTGTVAVS